MKAVTVIFICLCLFTSMSVCCQPMQQKLSPYLLSMLKKGKADEVIKVLITTKDADVLKKVAGIFFIGQYGNTALITTTAALIDSFAKDDKVQFISAWRQPKEELTTGAFDLSLNKINLVHNNYPIDNGSNIVVSVKEQRFDTTDIDWKGRYNNTGVAAPTESTHASIMATIIGGGANSSPFAKGVAWGSTLTSSNFATLLPDANTVYTANKIYVQNHSYGTTIENFYGADAAAYDASVYSIPTLVHVFSAGNSGTSSPTLGIYAGIANFANLTGSFKMAKNIITVGHVDSSNAVLPLSSRGPAYDGRIKPELVAFGEDGSSGAAALVSGTVAILQQAYKQSHNNLYPSAALIKAILINSADDIGNAGPDYSSGYGSLNAFNAMKTLTNNNFFEDVVTNGQVKNFPITVPANARQLKVTITWTDTSATPNATKALVNDLDAVLISPLLQSWQPWVLNSKAVKDSLQLPAIRSTDTLNNVEQITVDNPPAGNYSLQVKGIKISTALQAFAVAYQADTANSFLWTYPSSSDIIKAGAKNYLRWQTNMVGNGSIEYSKDGTVWQTVASTDLSKNYFVWTAPDTLTTALLRMKLLSPTLPFVSDTFVISPLLQAATGFNCSDSFLLYWNKIPAFQYQVYQLGSQYLQPILSLPDTFAVFQKQAYPSLYYAVAPKAGNKVGQRSFTINYTTQGVGCYIVSFFSRLQNNNAALLSLQIGTLYHVAEISFQKFTGNDFQTLQSFSPTSLSQSFTDVHLTEGINRYRVQLKLTNGLVFYSDEDEVTYFPNQPVIVYPNPSSQNRSINILVKDQGVYAVLLYDVLGRLVKAFELNDIFNAIPSFTLSKGIYFVQVTMKTERLFTQKLVVY